MARTITGLAAGAALAALTLHGTPASAEVVPWKAELKAASEVPPNDSQGKGQLEANYDTETKKLTWTLTFSGLTGPVTAAHFHGPADPGKNGPILVPISNARTSPVQGSATLS